MIRVDTSEEFRAEGRSLVTEPGSVKPTLPTPLDEWPTTEDRVVRFTPAEIKALTLALGLEFQEERDLRSAVQKIVA